MFVILWYAKLFAVQKIEPKEKTRNFVKFQKAPLTALLGNGREAARAEDRY